MEEGEWGGNGMGREGQGALSERLPGEGPHSHPAMLRSSVRLPAALYGGGHGGTLTLSPVLGLHQSVCLTFSVTNLSSSLPSILRFSSFSLFLCFCVRTYQKYNDWLINTLVCTVDM